MSTPERLEIRDEPASSGSADVGGEDVTAVVQHDTNIGEATTAGSAEAGGEDVAAVAQHDTSIGEATEGSAEAGDDHGAAVAQQDANVGEATTGSAEAGGEHVAAVAQHDADVGEATAGSAPESDATLQPNQVIGAPPEDTDGMADMGGQGGQVSAVAGKAGVGLTREDLADQETTASTRESNGGGLAVPRSNIPKNGPLGPGPFSMDDFDAGVTLGTGSFGRVRFTTHRATQTPWAIKILKKAEIIRMQQVRQIQRPEQSRSRSA